MKYVILDDCVGCESCVGECSNGAIVRGSERCQILSSKCEGCARCVDVCPVNAIVKS